MLLLLSHTITRSCVYMQVNQLRNHIEKMHSGLAIRVRKPLPKPPTQEQVELAYEAQVITSCSSEL